MTIKEREQELLDIKDAIHRWFEADIYTVLDKESEEWATLERITTISDLLKPFLENVREQVRERLEQNQYEDAAAFMHKSLEQVDKLFGGTDDAITARIMMYRRLGFIFERWATFGDLSKLPLTDKRRSISFLRAIRWYALGDLETGYVSDYALRIGECFAGAQVHDLFMAAINKAFGNREVVVIGNDPQDKVVLQDLINRATEITELEDVPGGGEAKLITAKLPNGDSN